METAYTVDYNDMENRYELEYVTMDRLWSITMTTPDGISCTRDVPANSIHAEYLSLADYNGHLDRVDFEHLWEMIG